jgi:hypothetical protein
MRHSLRRLSRNALDAVAGATGPTGCIVLPPIVTKTCFPCKIAVPPPGGDSLGCAPITTCPTTTSTTHRPG